MSLRQDRPHYRHIGVEQKLDMMPNELNSGVLGTHVSRPAA
jgi:hypothetical protein